eukprot:958831-Karenia_brevis.AAC.1
MELLHQSGAVPPCPPDLVYPTRPEALPEKPPDIRQQLASGKHSTMRTLANEQSSCSSNSDSSQRSKHFYD